MENKPPRLQPFYKRHKDEQPLANALQGYLAASGLAQRAAATEVLQHWPELVGEAAADATLEAHFRDGCLRIKMANPAWRHELSFRRTELLATLNAKAGYALFKEVRFT